MRFLVGGIFATFVNISLLAVSPQNVYAQSKPVSLIDWNIQVGTERGIGENGWKKRRHALVAIISRSKPDILCLQEALSEQIEFVRKEIPGYSFVGNGRDDGKNGGEYCPILYGKRMELLDSGTFWLSDTPDSSAKTWDGIYKRICTWARFRDLDTGNKFCVFNTHFPLLPLAREKAIQLLLRRMITECPRGKFILSGDFNCEPGSGPWRAIEKAGLRDAEFLFRKSQKRTKTYHAFGKPLYCLDAVFFSSEFRIRNHSVVQNAVKGIFPSDHFATAVNFDF